MYKSKAYSAASATSALRSTTIPRREPTEHDVQIEILFCGICHSDLHQVRNEWSGFLPTVYPCVPGHEIVGRVTKVGSAVTKFKLGDLAAVDGRVQTAGIVLGKLARGLLAADRISRNKEIRQATVEAIGRGKRFSSRFTATNSR